MTDPAPVASTPDAQPDPVFPEGNTEAPADVADPETTPDTDAANPFPEGDVPDTPVTEPEAPISDVPADEPAAADPIGTETDATDPVDADQAYYDDLMDQNPDASGDATAPEEEEEGTVYTDVGFIF